MPRPTNKFGPDFVPCAADAEFGIPSRFFAWLMPVDPANRKPRVETGQGRPEPHEETEAEQARRERADTIAPDTGPMDAERRRRHP